MDNIESKDKNVVAFVSPYQHTTSGHRNILNVVLQAFNLIEGARSEEWVVQLISQKGALCEHMLTGLKPRMIVVDFPDTGIRTEAAKFTSLPGCEESIMIGLEMYSPPNDWDTRQRPHYQLRIGLEPECLEMTNGVINISPVLNSTHLAQLSAMEISRWYEMVKMRGAAGDSGTLVMLTGTPDEKQHMRAFIRKTGRRGVVFSDEVPQPAVRFARLADHIYASGGYSTVWELCCLSQMEKVEWVLFHRPSEDCQRRIEIARAMNGTITPNTGLWQFAELLGRMLRI